MVGLRYTPRRMEQERRSDAAPIVATVLYLLFLLLYPITASLMDEVTSNTVIAVATVVNVLVTAVYAFFTLQLWRQTRVAADAARKGADASVESTVVARQALVEVQRAYMFVKAFRADVDRDAQARPIRWRDQRDGDRRGLSEVFPFSNDSLCMRRSRADSLRTSASPRPPISLAGPPP